MQEPQPQLAELLRTCVHPPSLLLLIVHLELLDVEFQSKESQNSLNVDTTSDPEVKHRYGLKFVLSDGEIMMQALLHRKLLRDTADVVVGDLLDIRRFTIKKARKSDGHGFVIYLAVEDCHFLQQVQSPGRTFIEGEAGVKDTNTRKRKRTLSQSHTGPARVGAISQMNMHQVSDGFLDRSLDEDSTTHKLSEYVVVDKDLPNATGAASLFEPPFNEVGKLRSLSNSHGDATLPHHDETRGTPPAEDNSRQRDPSHILRKTFGARQIIPDDDDDDDNFFEALSTNQTTVKKRRRALQKLDGNTSFGSQVSSASTEKVESDGIEFLTPFKPPPIPGKLSPIAKPSQPLTPYPLETRKSVRDGTLALSQTPTFYHPPLPPVKIKPQPPPPRQVQTQPTPLPVTQPALLPSPPFHTLSSLRNPPSSQPLPSKSYTLTTLAIISWTGTTTIHRTGSLFPPKRHLKVVDPSLSESRPPSRQAQPNQSTSEQLSSFRAQNNFQNAVTVAVYIDAVNFKPPAGTIVLFRGLVMQRLVNGDVILNAYGRLKEQRFEEITDDKSKKAIEGKEENVGQTEDHQVPDLDQAQFSNHWFITDHAKIRNLGHGSRLDYYLDWWAEKQRVLQDPQK